MKKVGKDKFHKPHYCENLNDVPYLHGIHKAGIGGEKLIGQYIEPPTSELPPGVGPKVAKWLALDKQVMCFDAYFQQSVCERREEQYQIRRCKIYFYLEDDTIQVVEPRTVNSGIAQGTIIRRQRIPKPKPEEHLFYTVHDFNIGKEFTAFGRTFRIVSCDEFTRNVLLKLGVKPGEVEMIPEDPYSLHQKAFKETMQPRKPREFDNSFLQFLNHDRHVLRFYCYWDDTESLHGDFREMVLNYFLSDDTIEIRETIQVNSGRDAFPTFLRRQKLPKDTTHLNLPGDVTKRTLLNVVGVGSRKKDWYIEDRLNLGANEEDCYKEKDLKIGASLNVFGRKFTLTDCDEFTKEYYRKKYALTDFTPLTVKKPVIANVISSGSIQIPPYNGWGSEDDSLRNCLSFMPIVKNENFKQFMALDRNGYESHCLRFLAHLYHSRHALDKQRLFIISYFLSDDTVSIFEMEQKNSGISPGMFLDRGKLKTANNKRYDVDPPEYYKSTDFYVGATLNINSFLFTITHADEYVFNYMEQNSQKFKMSDINSVKNKLKAALETIHHGKQEVKTKLEQFIQKHNLTETTLVDFDQLKNLVNEFSDSKHGLVLHELITLGRFYAMKSSQQIDYSGLCDRAKRILQKAEFDNFVDLLATCDKFDLKQSGLLNSSDMRCALIGHRVPFDDSTIQEILNGAKNQQNEINYRDFVNALDWTKEENWFSCNQKRMGEAESAWMRQKQSTGDLLSSGNAIIHCVKLFRDCT